MKYSYILFHKNVWNYTFYSCRKHKNSFVFLSYLIGFKF